MSGFANFSGDADGVAYEQEINDCMRALDAIPVTTIAFVDGWAVGGRLNIAAACDFRIATPDVSPWAAQPTDISYLACKIVGSTRAMPTGENTMSETGIRPVPWHAIDAHNQDGSVFA
ncbi:hypothetical protein [Bosea sp. OAE506]|uniref:hypothetical protein n=1 Tax=Bosea sp. OAE506 TaxID=2663870 RepID=UPI00339A28E4